MILTRRQCPYGTVSVCGEHASGPACYLSCSGYYHRSYIGLGWQVGMYSTSNYMFSSRGFVK